MESFKIKQIRQILPQNNWTILEGKGKDNTRQDKTGQEKRRENWQIFGLSDDSH